MSDIQRMTVVFPETMATKLRAAVEAGEYASTSEVVREAVRQWDERRQFKAEELARLRNAWDAGKASGPTVPCDMKQILKSARARRG